MQIIMSEIFDLLGRALVYAGGSTATAYAAFKWFGEKWIEDKFSRRLAALQHQQALEIQRLKIEIDSLLSGTLRIQEHEFLILPEIWEKLSEAYGLVSWIASPVQEYENINGMTSAQLEEYLEGTDLRESEKMDIRESDNKSKTHQKKLFSGIASTRSNPAYSNYKNAPPRTVYFFQPTSKKNWTSLLSIYGQQLHQSKLGEK